MKRVKYLDFYCFDSYQNCKNLGISVFSIIIQFLKLLQTLNVYKYVL